MKSLLPVLLSCAALPCFAAHPPIDLGDKEANTLGAPNYTNAAVTLPDGTIESYYRRAFAGSIPIFRMISNDSGRAWTKPEPLVQLSVEPWGGPMPMIDRDGEVHFVIPKLRGEGRKPAIDRFIDLYHLRSTAGRTKWSEPVRIYEGYCGSLQGVFQLASGRILVPFADWLPGVRTAPPTGPEVVICLYSDDGGKTWQRSPSKLTSPCHEGYNGSNYGACEPSLIEVKNGVWMLMRTQDGYLYESFSKDGSEWSEAKRSRFYSSNSPAFQARLPDGRLVVFWNNCQPAPRVGKDGVYSGRDALHAAISADEGKTWRGFREVYRDLIRNVSPPKDGDRGTAYPHATVTKDGKILLVSGQGNERRRRFLIEPDWLLEKSQSENFASLDAWHLFKGFGPAARFWRDRVQGPELVPHPDKPNAKVLHIRRPDERDADGAVWNFPTGVRGKLTLRLRVEKGSAGGQIGLTDRMFEPCDDTGEKLAAFALDLGSITPEQWHDVELAWDVAASRCAVTVDGKPAAPLTLRQPAPDGLSYLRLRSSAKNVDTAGFLVESVKAEIE